MGAIFFYRQLNVLNSCSAFISTNFFFGTHIYVQHKQNKQKQNGLASTLMAIGMMIRGPNYPLIAIDVFNRYELFECVDSYVTHIYRHLPIFFQCHDKYATLDRISLMHSNNHKAVRLSNRNLLNGPFDQRSMVWTNDSRTNANDSDGAIFLLFSIFLGLLKVLLLQFEFIIEKWRMQFLSSINYLKQLP